jgi:hypothetical protein
MNELTMLALAKFFKDNSNNFIPKPGHHSIEDEFTIKVKGTVFKGNDVDFTPTVEIPLLSTLALVLEKSGFQREKSQSILIEAMTEALENESSTSQSVKERIKDIERAMKSVRQITGSLPLKKRTGPTKFNLEVELQK